MTFQGQPVRFPTKAQYRNAPDAPTAIFTNPSPPGVIKLAAFDTWVSAVNLSAPQTAELPSLGSTGAGHQIIINNGDPVEVVTVAVAPSDIANGFLIEGLLTSLELAPGETVALYKLPLTTPTNPTTTTEWKIAWSQALTPAGFPVQAGFAQMFGAGVAVQVIGAAGVAQPVATYIGPDQATGAPVIVADFAAGTHTIGDAGDGDWLLSFGCQALGTAGVILILGFAINGVPILPGRSVTPNATPDPVPVEVTTVAPGLVAGDIITATIQEAGGNNVDLQNMVFLAKKG